MSATRRSRYYDYILLVLFLSMFIMFGFFFMTGTAWETVSEETAFLGLSFLVASLATVSGVVFIYSLVHYTQIPNLRSLIIMLLGANVVVLSFLFLITHPSAMSSIYASRDRNRTIVSALGFLLTPGVLAGSVFGSKKLTTKNRNIVMFWGIILQPLFALSLLVSPDALFQVTDPSGGLVGLTPFGWALTIVVGSTAILSLFRYTIEWYRTRERIVLGSALGLVFWLFSFFVYSILESPYQIAEFIWVGGLIAGFVLLSGAMIFTAIIEPHRGLETIVERRTDELRTARKESDLYLAMWVHKMGNLLQGIVSYLEILSLKSPSEGEYMKAVETALSLSKESTFFNRQVATLSEVKSVGEKNLVPYKLRTAIDKAVKTVEQVLKGTRFRIDIEKVNDALLVMADNKLDILFTNLFINEILSRDGKIHISVSSVTDGNRTEVLIETNGSRPAESELEQLLKADIPEITTLNLNLFSVRLLLERYKSNIVFERDGKANLNRFVLEFQRFSG